MMFLDINFTLTISSLLSVNWQSNSDNPPFGASETFSKSPKAIDLKIKFSSRLANRYGTISLATSLQEACILRSATALALAVNSIDSENQWSNLISFVCSVRSCCSSSILRSKISEYFLASMVLFARTYPIAGRRDIRSTKLVVNSRANSCGDKRAVWAANEPFLQMYPISPQVLDQFRI